MFEITTFTKSAGPMTKQITLGPDGKPKPDGSACAMSSGSARRVRFDDVAVFAELIGTLPSNQAIALGALRSGVSDEVEVVTKSMLNGATTNIIARTAKDIIYQPKHPALALLDYDQKAMPAEVQMGLAELGGFWPALVSVMPELEQVARVTRRSTSAGLFRTDTGERFHDAGGMHVYIAVKDGADVRRFLTTLHIRCWLAGLGWMMVGGAGQLLERSIVDATVWGSERLVFEGAPILHSPLAQDDRQPTVCPGTVLDTHAACPPLTVAEKSTYEGLIIKAKQALGPEAAKVRQKVMGERAKGLAQRTGMDERRALHIIQKQYEGILLPNVELPFDDETLAGVTVADVLANPLKYEGCTLADPLEGVGYGKCKAKILQREDGQLWIHSFAHGRTVYELRHDFATAKVAIESAHKEMVELTFISFVLTASLNHDEEEKLRNLVAERSGTGKRSLDKMVKDARAKQARDKARQERDRRRAERSDSRAYLLAPASDAERTEVIRVIDGILAGQTGPEVPMRDTDGRVTEVRSRAPQMLHAVLAAEANPGEKGKAGRLPAPEMPLLTAHDEYSLAHLIERHIEYFELTETGSDRTVALNPVFIRHYAKYRGSKLPVCAAVVTAPLVLPDGTLLATPGLDRQRGIVFRLQPELVAVVPKPEECTPAAVAEAMRFLCDEWLCDVTTDFAGKCTLIASALSIQERALLPERPAFIITAAQPGTGKTTVLQMIFLVATGYQPPAAAWSSCEEERRKSLFSYLGEGVPAVVWDNIARGTALSCTSIERSLTGPTYSDRVLGITGTKTVPATTINFFTGNNITARGDMVSRSLPVRLTVDRPDPENRGFKHIDPIAWTLDHRAEILRALYTILLGNPRLRDANPPDAETRFKIWWHLVGSAVEYAARQWQPAAQISFKGQFQSGAADDEQTSSLAIVLDVIRSRWPDGTSTNAMSTWVGSLDAKAQEFKAALEQASSKFIKVATPTVLTWRLKAIADAPVALSDGVFALRFFTHHEGGMFKVETCG